MTHYETLKIEKGASGDEIKRAYFKLVRQYSPERYPEEFGTIRTAYDVLSNAGKRKRYDNSLAKSDARAKLLSPEYAEMWNEASRELDHGRPGIAAKIAEKLYEAFPKNSEVMALLCDCYFKRGWRTKADELQKTFLTNAGIAEAHTVDELQIKLRALETQGASRDELFAASVNGLQSLVKYGNDDIDVAVDIYLERQEYSHSQVTQMGLPPEFSDTDKLLDYMLSLAERGHKSSDSEQFAISLFTPLVGAKPAGSMKSAVLQRMSVAIDIIEKATVKREQSRTTHMVIDSIKHQLQNRYLSDPAAPKQQPERVTKIGRNEPCPCGSGKKYKKCHGLTA